MGSLDSLQCFGGPIDGAKILVTQLNDGRVSIGIRQYEGIVRGMALLRWAVAGKRDNFERIVIYTADAGSLRFLCYDNGDRKCTEK